MKATRKAISNVTACGAGILLLMALLFLYGFAITNAAQASGTDTWQALQEAIDQAEPGSELILTADLTALSSDTAIEIGEGKNLTLDLNGHTLNRQLLPNDPGGPVIFIKAGAILTLRDSGTAEGIITGGHHSNGGGIQNRGTLILEGGCITGNTARDCGGGIANYGTMILLGGRVTGNAAQCGGGVWNEAKAQMTVVGDIISGNTAPKQSEIFNEGTLTMTGPGNDPVHTETIPVLRNYMSELAAIPAAALLFALILAVQLDPYLIREHKRVMAVIAALIFILMLQNYLEYRASLVSGTHALRIPLAILGYTVRPVILAMFFLHRKAGQASRNGVDPDRYQRSRLPDSIFLRYRIQHRGGSFQSGPPARHLYSCQRDPVCLAVLPDDPAVSSAHAKGILDPHSGDPADHRSCHHGLQRRL